MIQYNIFNLHVGQSYYRLLVGIRITATRPFKKAYTCSLPARKNTSGCSNRNGN
jgi:hypothetical protein